MSLFGGPHNEPPSLQSESDAEEFQEIPESPPQDEIFRQPEEQYDDFDDIYSDEESDDDGATRKKPLTQKELQKYRHGIVTKYMCTMHLRLRELGILVVICWVLPLNAMSIFRSDLLRVSLLGRRGRDGRMIGRLGRRCRRRIGLLGRCARMRFLSLMNDSIK